MKKRILLILKVFLISAATIYIISTLIMFFIPTIQLIKTLKSIDPTNILVILFVIISMTLHYASTRSNNQETEIKLTRIAKELETRNNTNQEKKIKDNFLSTSNITFYFANKEQIKNLYKTYFHEAVLNSLISETSGDKKGEIKGKTGLIEATIGSSKASKLTSVYKSDEITLEGMFIRYQREMLRTDQVKLIPEEINYSKKELNAFDNAIQNIQQNYKLSLNQEEIEDRRNNLRIKSVQNVLTSLENLSGWVLIEGRFTIGLEDQNYKCTYTHPINNHLPTQSPPITISMNISPQTLEDNIKSHFAKSINTEIPLKVYAKIWHSINTNKNVWDIYLDPLAIY